MRRDRSEARAFRGRADDRPHPVERPMGRTLAEEDSSRGDARTSAHIGAQGPADVVRKRKLLALLPLAVDDDRAAPPIDVIERQRENLARAQTQAGEQQDDRDIACPESRPSIAALPQTAKLAR